MKTFSLSSLALGIFLVSICYLFLGRVLFRWRKSHSLPLPPGPFRWPILGNALQIPQTHTWLTYTKWAKLYGLSSIPSRRQRTSYLHHHPGDIIYLEVVGQPLVILNSANAAKDLLDKRSSIYSDRPHLVRLHISFLWCSPLNGFSHRRWQENCEKIVIILSFNPKLHDRSGYGKSMVLEPYGNNWRKQRKMTTHDFAPTTVARYHSLQETEARKLIRSVLMDPTTLFSQTKL